MAIRHSIPDAYDRMSAEAFLRREPDIPTRKRSRGERRRDSRRVAAVRALVDTQSTGEESRALWWARYHAYIQSPKWLAFKRTIISQRGAMCERCYASGSDRRVDLHHLSYANLGQETRDDVKLLCHRCHQLMHPDKRIL